MKKIFNLNIFLPIMIKIISSSKSKNEIINVITNKMDQTWYVDLNKKFRGKIKDDKIHLWTNVWFAKNRQHYYISFYNLSKNNNTYIKILSNNGIIGILSYVIGMIFGIIGIISIIISKDDYKFLEVLFVILWIILVFIFTNIIPKYYFKKDIEYIIKLIK